MFKNYKALGNQLILSKLMYNEGRNIVTTTTNNVKSKKYILTLSRIGLKKPIKNYEAEYRTFTLFLLHENRNRSKWHQKRIITYSDHILT